MTERSGASVDINPSDFVSPSTEGAQHSDAGFVDSVLVAQRVNRLGQIVAGRRRPVNPFNIEVFQPDATGGRSLDQICIKTLADALSARDYLTTTVSERPVGIVSEVEGAPVRGGSAHGVSFIALKLQNGENIEAAAKAFSNPHNAFAEFVNTLEILRRGIPTLSPLAVVIDNGEGKAKGDTRKKKPDGTEPVGYYLSKTEPIRSMDRLRVIRQGYASLQSGSEHDRDYLGYMNRIGETLATMHLKGIFPGDSQLKNFAIRNDGTVIPIDFENVDIFNPDFYSTNPPRFVDLSIKGLRVLFDSLNGQKLPGINFFAGLSGEALWEAFDQTIFSSYKSSIEDSLLEAGMNGEIDEVNFITGMDTLLESLAEIRQGIRDHIVQPVPTTRHK